MKSIWAVLALVLIGGAVAMLWPTREASKGEEKLVLAADLSADAGLRSKVTAAAALNSTATFTSTITLAHETAPARIDRQADGSTLLDGRFSILGSGSENDPFRIGWPLLISASETIDTTPVKSTGGNNAVRITPPKRVDFLNGQWVQVNGFLAPPLWGEQTSELLVMKNRWDGCCIGLPPTAFDCIEATLRAPVKLGQKHSISFGTLRGQLKVEPFVAGGFLIGLYRLEDAMIVTDYPN